MQSIGADRGLVGGEEGDGRRRHQAGDPLGARQVEGSGHHCIAADGKGGQQVIALVACREGVGTTVISTGYPQADVLAVLGIDTDELLDHGQPLTGGRLRRPRVLVLGVYPEDLVILVVADAPAVAAILRENDLAVLTGDGVEPDYGRVGSVNIVEYGSWVYAGSVGHNLQGIRDEDRAGDAERA